MLNAHKSWPWLYLEAVALFVGVIILSAFREFFDIPETYFSSKRNILNQYFVKFGWAWTLALSALYVLTGTVNYYKQYKRKLFNALARSVILTIFWFLFTITLFGAVSRITYPDCVNYDGKIIENVTDERSCMKLAGKHYWIGFDISGHAFILTLTILMISSELQKQYWKTSERSEGYVGLHSKAAMDILLPFFYGLNLVLIFIWGISLIATCLYFHVFLSKMLGAGFGIFSWWICYFKIFPFLSISLSDENGTNPDSNLNPLLAEKITEAESKSNPKKKLC
ncbi:acyl-coenzyme A diphosphatase FITM2-like [Styela clava]